MNITSYSGSTNFPKSSEGKGISIYHYTQQKFDKTMGNQADFVHFFAGYHGSLHLSEKLQIRSIVSRFLELWKILHSTSNINFYKNLILWKLIFTSLGKIYIL